jgi:hypothetical protein
MNSIRKANGIQYAVSYMKQAKLHITRYISGKPLKVNNKGVSLTSDYFPTRLLFLKPYVDSGKTTDLRIVMTLLSLNRVVEPTKEESSKIYPKFSSITDPYKGRNYTIPKLFIQEFVSSLKLRSNIDFNGGDDNYISMKQGPMGPSTLNAKHTILYLGYNVMQYIITLSGGKEANFVNFYKACFENLLPNDKAPSIGKLSIVNDPELKLRVIAMVDYHSQLVLKSIHHNLLSKLSRLSTDRTFTQSPFHN